METIKRLIRWIKKREISDELMEAYLSATEQVFDQGEVDILRSRGLL